MLKVFAIVLAAGQGKRMKSQTPKVAHKLLNKTLLQWTLDAILNSGIQNIMVVISHHPILEKIFDEYQNPKIKFCYQENPLGTAHAVQCGLKALTSRPFEIQENESDPAHKISRPWDDSDKILIAYGDTPCVKSETYKNLIQFHNQEQNAITIVAFYAKNPYGYGRIVLDENGNFFEIREEKDCSEKERKGNLCHSGLMCANFDILDELLPKIKNKNQASEFYLTDIVHSAKKNGHKVGFIASDHENEFSGINTQEQLAFLESTLCAE